MARGGQMERNFIKLMKSDRKLKAFKEGSKSRLWTKDGERRDTQKPGLLGPQAGSWGSDVRRFRPGLRLMGACVSCRSKRESCVLTTYWSESTLSSR